MKKLMIAFLCCFGVGLTMMASPAQVSDDDITVDAKNKTAVQTNVSERNNASTRQLIKHEWKMKKVDFSKMNGPRRISVHGIPLRPFGPAQRGGHPIPPPRELSPQGTGGGSGTTRVDVTLSEWSSGGNGNETDIFTVPTRDR